MPPVDTTQTYTLLEPDLVLERLHVLEHQQIAVGRQVEQQQIALWVLAGIVLLVVAVQVRLWLRQRSLVREVTNALETHALTLESALVGVVAQHLDVQTAGIRSTLAELDHEAAEVARRMGRALGGVQRDVEALQVAVLAAHKGVRQ